VFAFLPHSLIAQVGPDRLRLGEPISSSLSADGPRLAEEGPFRSYRFEGTAGTSYRISLRSSDFQPHLRIGRTVAGVTDYLLTGGYHGLGEEASLVLTAEESDTYLITVQSADGATGNFALLVSAWAPTAESLTVDQPVSNTVDGEVQHSFRMNAGEEVVITARSRDFDTLLEVGRMAATGFVSLDSDDDGAGDTDSRLYFTAPADGEYVARLTPYAGGDGGGYAIVLEIPVEFPNPLPLTPGSTVEGEITDAIAKLDDGLPFVDWVIHGEPGMRFRIDLGSPDFDTKLSVGRMNGREFIEGAANDDAAQPGVRESDSRLILVVREAGEQIVRVKPFADTERGRYTLVATQLEQARLDPAGGTIEVGASVGGEISDTDAILPDGTPFHEWRFVATMGQRFDIRVASDDFDTYLTIGPGVGGPTAELASNDDGEQSANGTDSRLVFAAPSAGEYALRIRPFGMAGGGSYSLTLGEAPPVRDRPLESRITMGQTLQGTIVDTDARLPDDSPYQIWLFTASAGQSLVIDMASPDFDAFLAVGQIREGVFVEILENDDFGTGADAQVTFVAPTAGEYAIRASPLYPDELGRYTVTLGTGR